MTELGQPSQEEPVQMTTGGHRLVVAAQYLQRTTKIAFVVFIVLLVVLLYCQHYYPIIEESLEPYFRVATAILVAGVLVSGVLHDRSKAVRADVPPSFVDNIFDETYDKNRPSKPPHR